MELRIIFNKSRLIYHPLYQMSSARHTTIGGNTTYTTHMWQFE